MRANKADMSNSRVTCITRFKNSSGVIIGYTIQNSVGQTVNMTTKVLRNSLDCGFAVKNLALTSDNRIIVTVSIFPNNFIVSLFCLVFFNLFSSII